MGSFDFYHCGHKQHYACFACRKAQGQERVRSGRSGAVRPPDRHLPRLQAADAPDGSAVPRTPAAGSAGVATTGCAGASVGPPAIPVPAIEDDKGRVPRLPQCRRMGRSAVPVLRIPRRFAVRKPP